MNVSEERAAEIENHHSDVAMRERHSSSQSRKKSSRHKYHRNRSFSDTIKKSDVDQFLFKPGAIENIQSKKGINVVSSLDSRVNMIKIEEHENDSPSPCINGAIYESSLSDLISSDDFFTGLPERFTAEARPNFQSSDKLKKEISDGISRATRRSGVHNIPPKSPKLRERKLSKVKGSQRTHTTTTTASKDEMVKKVDKYLKVCNLNYEQVESEINSAFSSLSNAINFRRKTLIEEARLIRDRKINALNLMKVTLESQKHSVIEENSCTINDHAHCKGSLGTEGGNKENTKSTATYDGIGINEPWMNGDNASVALSDSKDNIVVKSGKEILEEGNMNFIIDGKTNNFINKVGSIKETLSSPQFSCVKGLKDEIRLIGNRIDFEVHTYDIKGETNVNKNDRISVRVYDKDKNKVNVETPLCQSPVSKHLLSPKMMSFEPKQEPSVYKYSFTPLKAGNHEIFVKLNDIIVANSPFTFLVYTKSDLRFENLAGGRMVYRHCSDSEFRYSNVSPPSGGEDSSVEDENEEDPFSEDESINGREWIVQSGGKSILLRSFTDLPSNIYATSTVTEKCAWQMRVTSACINIVVEIGLKTQCGIQDLDEQFTSKFHLGNVNSESCELEKMNHSSRRKSSMFTRLSWIFTFLLNGDVLRIICHKLHEDINVKINLSNRNLMLFPFCSMIHYHEEFQTQVCPRPQLTFL